MSYLLKSEHSFYLLDYKINIDSYIFIKADLPSRRGGYSSLSRAAPGCYRFSFKGLNMDLPLSLKSWEERLLLDGFGDERLKVGL